MRYASTRLGLVAAVAMSAVWVAIGVTGVAKAASVDFSFSSGTGSDYAAKATFDDSTAGILKITLWNLATAASTNSTGLESVYWNTMDSFTVTGISTGPASFYNPVTQTFGPGLSAITVPSGTLHGVGAYAFGTGKTVSANGIDLIGKYVVTGTAGNVNISIATPSGGNPDGPGGEIVSGATADNFSPNGGNPHGNQAVKDSWTYTLTYTGTFNVADINANSVYFAYNTDAGTAFQGAKGSTHDTTPVPLPAAVWSGMALLAVLGVVAKVRRKSLLC